MALPATLAMPAGNRTLRRQGGFVVPGVTSSDPLSLTGAAATAGYQVELIADEYNVSRWMITIAGTANAAPPATISGLANGATVTGTLTSGATNCALTITIEDGAYDVRPKWSDTNSSWEMRLVYLNTVLPLQLGNRIRLRPGEYGYVQGDPFSDQRLRFNTPAGTWTGSNYVIVSPRVPYEAQWARIRLDGATSPTRNLYTHFTEIEFTPPPLTGQDPNGQNTVYFVSACNYVKFDYNRVWGQPTQGLPPNGTGRDLTSAFAILGNFIEVTHNDVEWCWNFLAANSLGQGLIVQWNDVRYVYNDGLKTNHYQIVIEDNFFTDKRCADPNSSGQGVHADMIQHLGYSDGISRSGFYVRRNIIVRGDGRPGWPDGQGLFFDDSTNSSLMLDVIFENNLTIQTQPNGQVLRNADQFISRGNATLLDPTVGPVVDTDTGTNPAGPYPVGIIISNASTGAAGSGGLLSGNISNKTTVISSAQQPPPTVTNNVLLDPFAVSGATSYADNFTAPVFGSALSSRSAVISAFTPKSGSLIATNNAGPLDTSGAWRTYGAATGVTLSGPSGGAELVASTNFTVGANGSIAGTVTVTPSDGGAGGTFTPTSVAISSGTPVATFTYTPPAGSATRTISVTNNGGLSNPASLSYIVNAPAVTTVTFSAPSQIVVGVSGVLTASVDGLAPSDITVTLTPVSGLAFGGSILIESGTSEGSTTITASTAGTKTITGTDDAGLIGPDPINVVAISPAVTYANVGSLLRCGFVAPIA